MMAGTDIGAARWYVKKLARCGLAAASRAGRVALGGRPRAGVRVLTYHRFGEHTRDPFCLSVQDFDDQMRRLAASRRAVTLAQVQAFVFGHGELPSDAVLVTIDDGNACVWDVARRVLRAHGIPAVAFVPAGPLVAAANGDTAGAGDLLSIDQLCRLPELGIAIGSHAWSHQSLGGMSAVALSEEIAGSRQTLQRWTGQPVDAFAYPFGRRGDFDSASEAVLRHSGYRCAFTSQHGCVTTGSHEYTLPRIKIEAGEPAWMFDLACDGAIDAWGLIDRYASRWQQRSLT